MVYEYDVPTASCPWISSSLLPFPPLSPLTSPSRTALYGTNLTTNLSLWFSSYRSPSYILRSSSVILVPPPPRTVPDTPVPRGSVGGKRIAIGREDGVLWMTNVMYREEGM